MRTTVTLEPDVARMLDDYARRTRKSFKETLNDAVRLGLGRVNEPTTQKDFVIEAKPMGLRAGIDGGKLNTLMDDLEAETFLSKQSPTPSQ